ncbi:hypothetical protein fHeYen901_157 [Yersinia phage fHe-Yen9-01]|uniref:Phage protein n=1 Tax=Yersinia phage fHe-Yen9-01 TaxID=1965363 RepID=A0A1V0DXR1_9CAUD|nr:hypothetical protein KNT60_gp156 [Yersinia phage fHe-Yen9-01]ARB05930.1 hypothetical protein fHeYen901_157 [Yersinia phage fHe-Yen9-01]
MSLLSKIKLKYFQYKYYNTSNEPIKCVFCGCTEFNSVIKETVDSHLAEAEINCASCHKNASYFAYGYYQPVTQYRWFEMF